MKCIITDDEPLAREGLADYVAEIDYLELLGQCEHPLQTMQMLQKETVDLLFLDIEMPKMNGLEFLQSLKNPPMVILTTAYQNYALEGFQLDVVDYLLKPITFNRFFKAVTKAKELFDLRQKAEGPAVMVSSSGEAVTEEYCFVKVENRLEKVLFREILYVEGMQNYVIIHRENDQLMTLMTLKSVEEKLPADRFIRTHKSFLVARDKVEKVEGNELFIGQKAVPISRTQREEVLGKVVEGKLWKK